MLKSWSRVNIRGLWRSPLGLFRPNLNLLNWRSEWERFGFVVIYFTAKGKCLVFYWTVWHCRDFKGLILNYVWLVNFINLWFARNFILNGLLLRLVMGFNWVYFWNELAFCLILLWVVNFVIILWWVVICWLIIHLRLICFWVWLAGLLSFIWLKHLSCLLKCRS